MKKYKVGEAAEILDVSVATLQRWDREGKLSKGGTGRANLRLKEVPQIGVTIPKSS
ncbi:MerR family DNA-binding transcriptional regulator [Lactobacillus delbrueckii]|uniref:MerR family DNA-binding transcriptional regulator n=1 Tax=Lactobacillus delbrueckii TaxID=1584 RepID=UPI003A599547